jgi:hypothetical protein
MNIRSAKIGVFILLVSVAPALGQVGDFDGDGDWDCNDVDALVAASFSSNLLFDLNGDGFVDLADLQVWLYYAGRENTPCGEPFVHGDVNLDGFVDGFDTAIVEDNLGLEDAGYCDGEMNMDFTIDGLDLIAVLANEGQYSCLPFPVDIKVLLQGSHDTANPGTMKTILNTDGYLEQDALQHPYDVAPWNYGAGSVLPPGFFAVHPDVVDWLYLQLLSGDPNDPPMVLEAESVGLLLRNGSVVAQLDGASPARFVPSGSGDFYVAVFHRNHLPVLSSIQVTFDPPIRTFGSVDFTYAMAKAFGTNPMVKVSSTPDRFAMWAGNAEADKAVQVLDFNIYLAQTAAGLAGYRAADFNMDGIVQALDFNMYIANTAAGASAQVP